MRIMPWGAWQKRPRCDVTCDSKGFGQVGTGSGQAAGGEAIAEPVLHWHCGIPADMGHGYGNRCAGI